MSTDSVPIVCPSNSFPLLLRRLERDFPFLLDLEDGDIDEMVKVAELVLLVSECGLRSKCLIGDVGEDTGPFMLASLIGVDCAVHRGLGHLIVLIVLLPDVVKHIKMRQTNRTIKTGTIGNTQNPSSEPVNA